MFTSDPLTAQCGALLPKVTHACIGVSPFNSYFSTERLTAMAEWALAEFSECHFFIPDSAAAYTLEALGYPPERAAHKARRQGQYVHNKMTTALTRLGVARPERLILGMEQLHELPRYRQLLGQVETLYAEDRSFQAACLDATSWVLDRKLPPGARPGAGQLRLAVRYFLAELPLFTDSAGVAGSAASHSVFVYHQRVNFLEAFYRRELPWRPAPGQGFLVLNEVAAGPALRSAHVPGIAS